MYDIDVRQMMLLMGTSEKASLDKTLTLNVNGTTQSITITGATICDRLTVLYGSFGFVHCKSKSDFITAFNSWYNINAHSLIRTAEAIYTTYKPLENVDRYEDSYTDTTTPYGGTQSIVKSDTYAGTTADVSETTSAVTSGTKTENLYGAKHIHGNIGVTKSTDLVTAECQLRFNLNMASIIASGFAHEEIC